MRNFLIDDPAPPTVEFTPRVTVTDTIRTVLRSRPGVFLTAPELADVTGVPITKVAGTLSTLAQHGEVDRLLPIDQSRGTTRQAFRWRFHPAG